MIASGGNPCGEAGYTHMTEAAYMKLRLLEADIPEERILCEENSRNTTQNAENILELINKHLSNLERPVVSVVTGGFHMRRVFRDFGLLQGMHPLRLQAVPAYGNHTRPDNWYKNLMGTYIVLNELRHLGIESPDAQWHTANPDDVLLNRPAVKYVEAPEQDASCLPVRKGNIKGILLCCNDGRQEPLCARSHYLIRLDGTIVQQIPDNHVAPYNGKKAQKKWCEGYLCVEMELPAQNEPVMEAFTPGFFQTQVWRSFTYAAELCTRLCRKYNLNPEGKGVLVSHAKAAMDGLAFPGKYPEKLWDPYNLTMLSFRITAGRIRKDDRNKEYKTKGTA